jgi:hypothetical protein
MMSKGNKTAKHIDAAQKGVMDASALEYTIQRLESEGHISPQQSALLKSALVSELESARYILKNLGAHLGIGMVFAFDLIPLPRGTIGRVGWVVGARVTATLRKNPLQARVHSPGVLLIAAIPWFGYAAYLLPLRKRSRDLSFIIANYTWLTRTGRTYEQYLTTAPSTVRKFARWLVPAPSAV